VGKVRRALAYPEHFIQGEAARSTLSEPCPRLAHMASHLGGRGRSKGHCTAFKKDPLSSKEWHADGHKACGNYRRFQPSVQQSVLRYPGYPCFDATNRPTERSARHFAHVLVCSMLYTGFTPGRVAAAVRARRVRHLPRPRAP
jgi:hypothetical protein